MLIVPFGLVAQTVYEDTFRWNGAGARSELDYIGEYDTVAEYLAGEDVTIEQFRDSLPWDNQWNNLDNWQVLNESEEWVVASELPSMQDIVQVMGGDTRFGDGMILIPESYYLGAFFSLMILGTVLHRRWTRSRGRFVA